MFIMVRGEVEITKRLGLVLDEETPNERLIISLKAEEGVCFGEMSLLENEPRSATVTALTECLLMEIGREDFMRLIKQNGRHGLQDSVAPGSTPVQVSAQDQSGHGKVDHRYGHRLGKVRPIQSRECLADEPQAGTRPRLAG